MQEKRKKGQNTITFSVRMPLELYDKLDRAAWENRVPKKHIVILSIENYLEVIEKKKND